MDSRRRGHSLLELMVALAVVGILAALAYPSYREPTKASYRRQAQADLSRKAAALTQQMARSPDAQTNPAPHWSPSGQPRTEKRYAVTLTRHPGAAFTLKALPRGPQAGDGFLRLDSNGLRCWDRNGDGRCCDAPDNGLCAKVRQGERWPQ